MRTMSRILIGICFIAVIGGLIGWGLSQLEVEVEVATSEQTTAIDGVTGTVQIFALADVNVSTERWGRITEMNGELGEAVTKGTVLAVQESTELSLRLEQAKTRLEAARKQLLPVNV